MPPAGLRTALLGERVPTAETGEKQHWTAHVPQARCGKRLRIKQLLYEQGFTIVGARQQLRSETKTDKGQAAIPFPTPSSPEIQHIRQGLREILSLLSARRTG